MKFIHMNVHSWFVINLYLTPSLISIYFELAFNYILIHF
jgi:hypothetical protein